MPEDWLNRAVLEEREFKAELPEDFVKLVSVRRVDTGSYLTRFNMFETTAYFSESTCKTEGFYINGNIIYFSGGFSRWWIIRIFQRFWNEHFPTRYELKYVNE